MSLRVFLSADPFFRSLVLSGKKAFPYPEIPLDIARGMIKARSKIKFFREN